MPRERDTVRLPLEPLRKQVADATGNAASFLDITDVAIDETALEVTFEIPDADVPVVDVVVEGPNAQTDTTPVRLDQPSGLKVYGELLRIEYAGRDAETNEILVSVARRSNDGWQTVLGCGQMWAVETSQGSDPVSVTCHVETPESEVSDPENEDDRPEADPSVDGSSGDFDGFLTDN
ncbi:hypothetical protein [Halobellus salinisoli]|uniref:hypothetical protein n=1 Tax=Halobellus salinisoli TaxID=3108500 RepID=UPI00300B3824